MAKDKTNYKDKSVVISRYMFALDYFRKYEEYIDTDPNKAADFLNTAGEKIYQAYELGMKNYLSRLYPKLAQEKVISYIEAQNRSKALEKPSFYFLPNKKTSINMHYLREQMRQYADPEPSDAGINVDLLAQNAAAVYNANKHKGENVDKTKYLESEKIIRKFILVYIDPSASLQGKQTSEFIQLQEKCNYWKRTPKYDLCLITGETNLDEIDYENIASIPWSLVFDFDTHTSESGLFKGYETVFKSQPNMFNIERPKRTVFDPASNKPYWFHANGVSEISTSVPSTMREWRQKYGTDLPACVRAYHEIFPRPLRVIVLGGEPKKVNTVLGALDAAYDGIKIFFATNDLQFEDLQDGEDYESSVSIFKMNVEDFAAGLNQFASALGRKIDTSGKNICGRDGEVLVRPENYSHFKVLYNSIAEEDITEDDKLAESFYKAAQPLSWYGAKNGFAIQRVNQYRHYYKELTIAVEDKPYFISTLWHTPGAGGTTLARQLAYDLTKQAPVVWLKYYIEGITRLQIEDLNSIVKMSIVIFADSADISNDEIAKFHAELKSYRIPHAILYVKRISRKSDRKQTDLLALSDMEFAAMEEKLYPYCGDDQRSAIRGLKESIDNRYPFFMAMYAFEEQFHGLNEYISGFIKNAKKSDLDILIFISIADKYANKSLPHSFFQIVDDDDQIGIFVDDENDILVTLTEEGNIKIRHQSFAEKIIELTIYGQKGEYSTLEKVNRMAEKLIEFIRISKSNQFIDYDPSVEILKNLLITRDTTSMVKEEFAPIIEELRKMAEASGKEGDKYTDIGRVLKTLVEVYPEEPHFLAHLSRFYTNIEKNYLRGIETATDAVKLAEESGEHDALLYHICGMSHYRYIERKLIKDAYSEEDFEAGTIKKDIQDELRIAGDLFQKVRATKNKMAGYISEIQMCICIVDFGKKIHNCSTEEFIAKYHDSWYMEYYERAITLMEGYRALLGEESNDFYTVSLENRYINSIEDMADGAEKTVLMWQRYLESADNKGKILARRFIARSKLEYESDNEEELKYVRHLMEENMEIEPQNGANIRLWFNSIRRLATSSPEILLDEALVKINIWKRKSDSVEAYYYYYVLQCIKALNGSSRAEAEIEDAKNAMCDRSHNMSNRNSIFEWLGRGSGIERLVPAFVQEKHKRRSLTFDEIVKKSEYVEGRIIRYHNERTAYIKANGIEVFFTPTGPKGAKSTITKLDEGKKVKFIMGFSFDGARALNKSVEFITDNSETDLIDDLKGKTVKCTVLSHDINGNYLNVRLSDYRDLRGSINKNDLEDGKTVYDYGKGPVYARVTGTYEYSGKRYLKLSLRPEDEDLDDWQKALKQIKL